MIDWLQADKTLKVNRDRDSRLYEPIELKNGNTS